jgi:hypothetical protein
MRLTAEPRVETRGEKIMKTTTIRAALAYLALAGTAAWSATTPIPGVDVIVKSHPAGRLIVHTDGSGRARLESLAPGNYTLSLGSQSLAAAMDRLAAPARRSGGGVRPGVGGSSGGGHISSGHRGVAPSGTTSGTAAGELEVPRSGFDVREGYVAVGDFNGDGTPDLAARGGPVVRVVLDLGPLGRFSNTAPYRRDHAGEGIALAFTVPSRGGARARATGGTVTVAAISDQASAGNLSSY